MINPVDNVSHTDAGTIEKLIAFSRLLRAGGIQVAIDQTLTFSRAVLALETPELMDVYWAGKGTLVNRREDFVAYDRLFWHHFAGASLEGTVGSDEVISGVQENDTHEVGSQGDHEGHDLVQLAGRIVASRLEMLRERSYTAMTEDERKTSALLIRKLRFSPPRRTSFRYEPSRRGRLLDTRRTLRGALRSGGEGGLPVWKRRAEKPRPIYVLVDISGSMSSYARIFFQLAHTAVQGGTNAEAFCFGTRLTRLTRALALKDPDRAIEAAFAKIPDWDGGTRLGASLSQLVRENSSSARFRRSVLIICSDGLERDDPSLLGEAIDRANRLVQTIVWVNPLSAHAGYEPLARGMKAAIPYVDIFESAHDASGLERLIETLRTLRGRTV